MNTNLGGNDIVFYNFSTREPVVFPSIPELKQEVREEKNDQPLSERKIEQHTGDVKDKSVVDLFLDFFKDFFSSEESSNQEINPIINRNLNAVSNRVKELKERKAQRESALGSEERQSSGTGVSAVVERNLRYHGKYVAKRQQNN